MLDTLHLSLNTNSPCALRSGWSVLCVLSNQRGVFIIEVLVAVLVLSIAAVGIAIMFGWSQGFIATQSDDQLALYLAQSKIESLRASGFDALQVGDETIVSGCPTMEEPCYGETGIEGGGGQTFTRETRVGYIIDDLSSIPVICTAGGSTTGVKRICVTVTPNAGPSFGVTLQSFCIDAIGGC